MNRQTNRPMVTVAMMVAILLVAIDVTVVSTAMPRIVADLSGIALFSWVFAIYTLTASVTTPIYGKLADLYGRKIIFTIGVVLFLLGSILSGASQTMMQLIIFRALQGVGAGAVMPITFTIIGDLFTGEERAKMQGVFSSVWGIAGILGPLVGGFFVDYGSWRWIFYINVPVGIVSLILVWMNLHERFERRQHKVDYLGATLFTVSISSLLYALLNGGQPNYAWTSATILTLFAVAVIGTVLFFVVEARASEPMLPLTLFKMRVIAISNLASFLASAVLIATNVYLPMWIQSILGHSATSSGLTLMPMSIGWPLAATIGGRLMYKVGSKSISVLGGILIVAGCVWLSLLGVNTPFWHLVAIMVVIGLGMGFSMTPFTVLIQASVPWRLRGSATASNTFMRSLGQTMGVAIYGTWFNQAVTTNVKAQFGTGQPPADFSKLLSPGATTLHVPKQVLEAVQTVLSHSLHTVFMVVLGTSILTLLSIFLLPLHKTVMQHQVTEARPTES
jgi:EmrB/QacA subfamily drug resistance transporter